MQERHENWTVGRLHKLANAIWKRPWLFLWPQLVLFGLCLSYTLTELEFSMTRADLVSDQVKYQRDFLEFKREFQIPDALVAVVESESLEKNRRFIERLASRLEAEPELFARTYYKGDLRVMGDKALLFLDEESLAELRRVLRDEWPFIEAFSEADSLNTVLRMVNREFREINPHDLTREEIQRFLPVLQVFRRMLDEASESISRPLPNSFPGLTALFGNQTSLYLTFGGGQLYVLVTRAADPSVEIEAINRLRELVAQTRDEVPGVNAGISGEPVLNLDEMSQARGDINLAAILSITLVALIFIYGFHEIARPVLATLCLMVGLVYALGFATISVGRLNILSITIMPILIGLAIDFGIHLISRFEEELRNGKDRRGALRHALAFTGMGIFTSGLTTAGAFFAMLLTDFKGIQEMGFLSGAGLLLCLAAMMTLLPALLVRGKTKTPPAVPARGRPGFAIRERIDRAILRSPALVVVCAALLTALSISQFPRLSFDYNLLNLQSSDLPAVAIEEKLIRTGSQSVLYGVVIADSLAEARQLEERLEQLEPVARVTSMVDYLTEDQQRKLRIIRDIKEMAGRLDPAPPSSAPVDVDELNETLFALQGYLGLATEQLRALPEAAPAIPEIEALRNSVIRLRGYLDPPGKETVARLTGFQRAIFANLRETVEIISRQDTRERLRPRDLPLFLREHYISPSGKYLLEVYPEEDLWLRPNQEEFLRALRAVDPDVTGTLVQVFEYTSLIKENFLQATAYAAGIIGLLLLIQFRRFSAMALAFLPVLLGLCWTLGAMAFFGIPFNPVNIMALTVLVGIGVPNGIHILQRFSEDPRPGILGRSTGKAVLVSAFTTIAGFGSLLIAKHQGIASLGKVMAIGTAMCMVAALVVLPAILKLFSKLQALGTSSPSSNNGKRP